MRPAQELYKWLFASRFVQIPAQRERVTRASEPGEGYQNRNNSFGTPHLNGVLRFDVLIHVKQVAWVIFFLDRHKPVVIPFIVVTDPSLVVASHEIHIPAR